MDEPLDLRPGWTWFDGARRAVQNPEGAVLPVEEYRRRYEIGGVEPFPPAGARRWAQPRHRSGDASSWEPIDPKPVLAREDLAERPTILVPEGGIPLLYPRRVNGFHGETETGRTFVTLHGVDQVMAAGGHVGYVDFEDSAHGIFGRLRELGVADETVAERFHYVRPDEPLPGPHVLAHITDLRPALVVVDGVTEAMVLHGWDPLSNRDAAMFSQRVARPLAQEGAAVLLNDHAPQRAEGSRFALGAQHKLSGIDGAAYRFTLRSRRFTRNLRGRVQVDVVKDRPGWVRSQCEDGKRLGDFLFNPGPGGRLSIRLRRAGSAPAEEDERRTRVLKDLRAARDTGEGRSARRIATVMFSVEEPEKKEVEAARRFLQSLVRKGKAEQSAKEGSAVLFQATAPAPDPAASLGQPL